jgi:hypothetical protein
MELRKLVRLAASGKTGFAAASESMTDLETFQSAAKAAREAYSLGYVSHFKPYLEFHAGHHFCDAFLISGVTDEGRHYAQLDNTTV